MFTGIVETIGTVKSITSKQNYLVLTVGHIWKTDFPKIGDSISCDGACLTITSSDNQAFTVEVSQETIARTIVKDYHGDSKINLERSVRVGDRLGGHFVSGHIDTRGVVNEIEKIGESIQLKVQYQDDFDKLVIEKGSIAINGVSLTVNETEKGWCEVNLIPHTLKQTNLSLLKKNSRVNIEFDLIGKYVLKASLNNTNNDMTLAKLSESGW